MIKKMKNKETDALEFIRLGVFDKKDPISKETINDTLDAMDKQLQLCVSSIIDSGSLFVQYLLVEAAVRAMGNMTYGRILYDKNAYESEKSWFCLVARLSHFISGRRSAANRKKTKELISQMRWARDVYEELIKLFIWHAESCSSLEYEESALLSVLKPYHTARLYAIQVQRYESEKFTRTPSAILIEALPKITQNWELYLALKNKIVEPYLRLVFSEAKKLSGPSRTIAEDAFQSGVFGLNRAVCTFFKERKTYFSGYATWWIRQSILLSLKEEVSFFKIPSAVWNSYNKLERGEGTKRKQDSEKIKQYIGVTKLVPIEQPIQYEGNTAKLIDTIIDEQAERDVFESEMSDAAESILGALDRDSARVVCLRFGLVDHLLSYNKLTEEEVAKERLRQSLALLKLSRTAGSVPQNTKFIR